MPDALVGDPGRLRQVLVNLVGNAIKFTERGEVVVDVAARVGSPAAGSASASPSRDTGIGIAAEKQRAIFEPFEQADGSTTRTLRRHRPGAGHLGPAGRADGRPHLGRERARPGQHLPLHRPARAAAHRDDGRRAVRNLPGLEGMPVLVVDDNATNRRILEEVLTNWGARPVSVDGGAEALAALRAASGRGEPFPIALIDGMMPGMSGLDLAERVRADRDLAGLVLLMLTSAGGPDDTGRYQSLGLSACLSKPIRQSELYNALMKALDHPEKARDGAPALAQSGDERRPAPAPAATTGGLHLLLAEDHVVNQKVAVRMLEGLGHSVVVAVDGRKALEALETGRFDAVLMDVQMPEMDGIEAVAAIRAGERGTGCHLPVIALTAHAMKGDRERFLASGFDAYLPKPIRAKELGQVLEEHAARTAAEAPPDGRGAGVGAIAHDLRRRPGVRRRAGRGLPRVGPSAGRGDLRRHRGGRRGPAGRRGPRPEGDQPDHRRGGTGQDQPGAGRGRPPVRSLRGPCRGAGVPCGLGSPEDGPRRPRPEMNMRKIKADAHDWRGSCIAIRPGGEMEPPGSPGSLAMARPQRRHVEGGGE